MNTQKIYCFNESSLTGDSKVHHWPFINYQFVHQSWCFPGASSAAWRSLFSIRCLGVEWKLAATVVVPWWLEGSADVSCSATTRLAFTKDLLTFHLAPPRGLFQFVQDFTLASSSHLPFLCLSTLALSAMQRAWVASDTGSLCKKRGGGSPLHLHFSVSIHPGIQAVSRHVASWEAAVQWQAGYIIMFIGDSRSCYKSLGALCRLEMLRLSLLPHYITNLLRIIKAHHAAPL